MTKLVRWSSAVTATVLVALMLASVLSSRSAAFGQVIEKIKQAKSVTLTITQQAGNQSKTLSRCYLQGDRMRMDLTFRADRETALPNNVMIVDFKKLEMLDLDLDEKTFQQNDGLNKEAMQHFGSPLKWLAEVTNENVELVGQEELDGHTCQVYQLKEIEYPLGAGKIDEHKTNRIWVDPKTGLPVKIVLNFFDTDNNRNTEDVYDNFRWNEPIAEELFSMAVPDGFKAAGGGGGEEVAPPFAQVLRNMKNAISVAFTCKQKIGDTPQYEQKYYYQGDQIHVEGEEGKSVQIANMRSGEGLKINHAQKIAVKIKYELGSDAPAMSPLESISTITEKDAVLIGEEELNGKDTRVYQLTALGPASVGVADSAKIWVDAITGLPVRTEIVLVSPDGRKASSIFENFQWNVPLKPELFSLDVPKGYALTEGVPVKVVAVKPALLAFTQVVENIRKATSVTFVSLRSDRPAADREARWYLTDGLERIETADKQKVSITNAAKKVMLRLNINKKTAQVRELTDPQAAVNPIEDLLKLTNEDTELIEVVELDGRKVRVYRLKRIVFPRFGLAAEKAARDDEEVNARVWVDDENNLPVRIVLELVTSGKQIKQSVVLEKFEWNKKLDTKLFELDIPQGFKLQEAKPKKAA